MRTKINSLNAGHIALLAAIAGLLYWMWTSTISNRPVGMRKAAFYEATLAAQPLIEAIERYTLNYGSPPGGLQDLVPRHIKEIPDTGLPECNRFKYARYGSSLISLVWYDLGSRYGRPVSKKGGYPDGDPGHAILVFTVGQGDNIVDARFDRMPKDLESTKFDSEKWLARENRIEMALSLPDEYEFGRMSRDVLVRLLGPADGTRVLRDTPWELRINCPTGIANREVLFYWPTEKYPDELYGGKTELVGNWLYIHE